LSRAPRPPRPASFLRREQSSEPLLRARDAQVIHPEFVDLLDSADVHLLNDGTPRASDDAIARDEEIATASSVATASSAWSASSSEDGGSFKSDVARELHQQYCATRPDWQAAMEVMRSRVFSLPLMEAAGPGASREAPYVSLHQLVLLVCARAASQQASLRDLESAEAAAAASVRYLFDILQRGFQLPVKCWNIVIHASCSVGALTLALTLADVMGRDYGVRLDQSTVCTLLSACTREHGRGRSLGCSWRESIGFLRKLEARGMADLLGTREYNLVIEACAGALPQPRVAETLMLLSQMTGKNIPRDSQTYANSLSCLAKAGAVEEARELLSGMNDKNTVHFNACLDAFANAKAPIPWQDAVNIFRSMDAPDEISRATVLKCLMRAQDPTSRQCVFEILGADVASFDVGGTGARQGSWAESLRCAVELLVRVGDLKSALCVLECVRPTGGGGASLTASIPLEEAEDDGPDAMHHLVAAESFSSALAPLETVAELGDLYRTVLLATMRRRSAQEPRGVPSSGQRASRASGRPARRQPSELQRSQWKARRWDTEKCGILHDVMRADLLGLTSAKDVEEPCQETEPRRETELQQALEGLGLAHTQAMALMGDWDEAMRALGQSLETAQSSVSTGRCNAALDALNRSNLGISWGRLAREALCLLDGMRQGYACLPPPDEVTYRRVLYGGIRARTPEICTAALERLLDDFYKDPHNAVRPTVELFNLAIQACMRAEGIRYKTIRKVLIPRMMEVGLRPNADTVDMACSSFWAVGKPLFALRFYQEYLQMLEAQTDGGADSQLSSLQAEIERNTGFDGMRLQDDPEFRAVSAPRNGCGDPLGAASSPEKFLDLRGMSKAVLWTRLALSFEQNEAEAAHLEVLLESDQVPDFKALVSGLSLGGSITHPANDEDAVRGKVAFGRKDREQLYRFLKQHRETLAQAREHDGDGTRPNKKPRRASRSRQTPEITTRLYNRFHKM